MDNYSLEQLWPHIRTLVVLAEQGSFTSAAKRLDVSKATVSQRIAQLERATGVVLVHRTTRSMRLTDAGQRLANRSRDAYAQIAHNLVEIQNLTDTAEGVVRVTAPLALARQHLIACLPEFFLQHPRINVELDMSDKVVSLTSEGFDLAVRHVDTPPDACVARPLSRTRTMLVASSRYMQQHGTLSRPEQLSQHRHLLYSRHRGSGVWTFERIGTKLSYEKHVTIPVSPYFVGNNSETLREMACASMGVALVPDFSAQTAIQEGRLIQLLPDWRPVGTFGRRIYILRPYSPVISQAVRLLWDYLIKTFPSNFSAKLGKLG